MTPRPFGKTGLIAAPLMLGGNVFGWTADRKASFAILDAFVEAGGSLIDTADVYSAFVPGHVGGESETIIGDWLRSVKQRENLLIATKVGLLDGQGGRGLSATRIVSAVEQSLKRLGTDYIDIYFAHRDDVSVPLEETLEAFDDLVRAGKVRVLGASNYEPSRLEAAQAVSDANGWTRFSVVQPRYNLLERTAYEGALQTLALREDLSVVPYFGLANGLLTGKYRNIDDVIDHARERFLRPLIEHPSAMRVIAATHDVAAECEVPMAAVAIAWLLAQPGITAPIASVSRPKQLIDLCAGTRLKLEPRQLAHLDGAGG